VFSKFFRQKKSETIGVEFLSDGIAIAVFDPTGPQKPPYLEWLPSKDEQEQPNLLKAWVHKNKFTNAITNVVLNSESYQTLLVEPPDVPDDELRSAIRWRLKDLIQLPVEQVVIDVFALPEDGTRGNKKMVYVVAADQQVITNIIAHVKQANLHLNAIDISELAIRNVTYASLPEDQKERGVAVAKLGVGSGNVLLYRQGNLYLARTFSLDYKGGLLDEVPQEALALELQRSVDYYERQMGQAPPSVIYVCGENVLEDKVGEVLRSSFAVPVEYLSLGAHADIEGENNVDQSLLQKGLSAVGCAMRVQVT